MFKMISQNQSDDIEDKYILSIGASWPRVGVRKLPRQCSKYGSGFLKDVLKCIDRLQVNRSLCK